MEITILTVGRLKEKYLVEGIKEYGKRISKYSKLSIVEVPDEKAPDNLSLKDIENVKAKEGLKLLARMKNDSYVIVLAIEGKKLTSENLAKKIEDIKTYHSSKITFVIGGSNGLSKEVIDKADYKLSFSDLTFPHQLMRLILLEQIYRSFRITNNEPYHK
ncbi:MAG: 23S rRNA (pseudouridine(1915)-N(3))-methyltransferase RlmH [Candidatus Izemoplasma sp.]